MADYSTYKDSELIPLLREPKPACDNAFNEIYRRHSIQLMAYCRYCTANKEQAEDEFQ